MTTISDHGTIFITRQIRYFVDDFVKLQPLGEPGTFGTAYKCFRKSDIDQKIPFAVKEMNKSRFTVAQPKEKEELLISMQNEISILLKLNHPSIVELYDVYESRDQIHLVMEYLPGGELFDRICEKAENDGGYGEKEAANIIKQVFEALNFCHSKKILHLDLKPENILFKDDTDDSVKLIDFGMARVVPRLTQIQGKIGTIKYMAPEIIEGKCFSFGADVWSCGVILYCMLFGFPPFNDYGYDPNDDDDDKKDDIDNDNDNKTSDQHIGLSEKYIQKQILKGFNPSVCDGYGAWFPKDMPISAECMKLISNMLDKDVTKRWTIKECLSSKWILQKDDNQNAISPMFRESLIKFSKASKFKVQISKLFCNYLDDDIKNEIHKFFNEMDTNKDGVLSLKEFEDGLNKLKAGSLSDNTPSHEQIELIFKNLDFNNDLTISLDELMTSTAMQSLIARDERLYSAFEKLDVNHDGKIDKNEMELAAKSVLFNNNPNNTDNIEMLQKLKDAFDEADTNNDGTVDYTEFLRVLHPDFDAKNDDNDNIDINDDDIFKRQKTVDTKAAKFNVSNKSAKGVKLKPAAYRHDDDDDVKSSNSNLKKENEKLKLSLKIKSKELNQAKKIYSNNIDKVLKLENKLKTKEKDIKSLTDQLDKKNKEIIELKKLLKSKQTQ